MQRFRKILVGLDLSSPDHVAEVELTPPNREALRRAIWLAAHTQGELTIFSSLDVSPHVQAVLQEELAHEPGDLEREAFEHPRTVRR